MSVEQLPVKVRCDCGALFDDGVRYCPECQRPRTYVQRELEQLAAANGETVDALIERDRAGVLTAILPSEVRSQRLQRVIARLSTQGFEVVSQSDAGAQLQRRKAFSWLLAGVFLILTAGIGLLIYLVYLMVAPKDLIYLSVDERGTVAADGRIDVELRAILRELNNSV